MKNIFKPLVIFLYFCTSCVSTKPNESFEYTRWSLLDEAKSLDCRDWANMKNELVIQNLIPLNLSETFAYFVNSRDRQGRSMRYIAFSDDGSAMDKKVNLNWGHDDAYISHFQQDGKLIILMHRKKTDNTATLELRFAEENIVLASSDQLDDNYQPDSALFDGKWLWVAYRLESESDPILDQPIRVAKYEIHEKKIKKIEVKNLNLTGDMSLIQSKKTNQNLLIVREIHSEKSHIPQSIKLVDLKDIAKKKPDWKTLVDGEDKIESWSAVSHDGQIYLAYVSGDTLLWQNAKLNLISFNLQGAKNLESTMTIDRVHVGDVRLIAVDNHHRPVMVMPQWLEEESTLGVYGLVDEQLRSLGVYGVFSQGTETFNAFSSSKHEGIFILNRRNDAYSKKYSICNIEL